uniref:Uncharacterized protein n=1 Tax=Arundo donax TaxID=35708 RepID=A0A0A9A0A7_ARUDO
MFLKFLQNRNKKVKHCI